MKVPRARQYIPPQIIFFFLIRVNLSLYQAAELKDELYSYLTGGQLSVELVHARSSRSARVLRVLCECYNAIGSVTRQLLQSVFGQGRGVSEGNVPLVRCCLWRHLVQFFCEEFGLCLSPFPNRGTSANQLVLTLNFWGAATCDELTREFLIGKLDNFSKKMRSINI